MEIYSKHKIHLYLKYMYIQNVAIRDKVVGRSLD